MRSSVPHLDAEEEGPWGAQAPDHYFRYFGQPVQGTLVLQTRPARIRARCHNEVIVASGGAAVEMRLELEAEVGSPDTIDLSLSESDGPEPFAARSAAFWSLTTRWPSTFP